MNRINVSPLIYNAVSVLLSLTFHLQLDCRIDSCFQCTLILICTLGFEDNSSIVHWAASFLVLFCFSSSLCSLLFSSWNGRMTCKCWWVRCYRCCSSASTTSHPELKTRHTPNWWAKLDPRLSANSPDCLFMNDVTISFPQFLSCGSIQGLCVSNLLAMTELITPEHYRTHRASYELKEDLEVLCLCFLSACLSVAASLFLFCFIVCLGNTDVGSPISLVFC